MVVVFSQELKLNPLINKFKRFTKLNTGSKCKKLTRDNVNNNKNNNNRLTRSLSTPRRCSNCYKMVYFRALRCKECGSVFHESCVTNKLHWCQRDRSNSYQLQLNNINENNNNINNNWRFMSLPDSTSSQRDYQYDNRNNNTESYSIFEEETNLSRLDFNNFKQERNQSKLKREANQSKLKEQEANLERIEPNLERIEPNLERIEPNLERIEPNLNKLSANLSRVSLSNAAMTLTGMVKVTQWLAHRRKSKEISKANANDKHFKGKFGLLDEKLAQKQLRALIKNSHKRASLSVVQQQSSQAAVYRRALFRHSEHRSFIISPNQTSLSSSGCVSSASSLAQTPSDDLDHRIQSSESMRLKSSSLCINANNSIIDKKNLRKLQHFSARQSVRKIQNHNNNSDNKSLVDCQNRLPSDLNNCEKNSSDRPYLITKARTLSLETNPTHVERICATWPQTETLISSINEIVCDDDESGFEEGIRSQQRIIHSPDIDVKETLKEWCIPFQDLQFKERIRQGRHGDIYRGQWHGDVFIYTFNNNKDNINNFWEEVAQLCLIRHENIMLFMGTCIDTSHLAVITSMCKGHSLHQQIHIKNQCLSLNVKLNIARQIAQGMGYLHARKIIHKRLNSINVILENSRVKICLMDQSIPKLEYERKDWGCVPKGHLSYVSPELMRSIQIQPPYIYPKRQFTKESDVYAFGTLLYEIFYEKFPFHGFESHQMIYLIGNDQHQDLDNMNCNNGLKKLIEQCWSPDRNLRPKFQAILRFLIENVPLHKHHSSSEPDRINRIGLLSMSKAFCS